MSYVRHCYLACEHAEFKRGWLGITNFVDMSPCQAGVRANYQPPVSHVVGVKCFGFGLSAISRRSGTGTTPPLFSITLKVPTCLSACGIISASLPPCGAQPGRSGCRGCRSLTRQLRSVGNRFLERIPGMPQSSRSLAMLSESSTPFGGLSSVLCIRSNCFSSVSLSSGLPKNAVTLQYPVSYPKQFKHKSVYCR